MDTLPTIQRPTIGLALIAKNEEKNVNRLLDSVEGCFDEIVFVDTGSTDNTKLLAEARGCKMYDFEWVNSFGKARNFAFSKVTTDYVMWLDLDDTLFNREAFIKWRDSAMQFADYWLATYHYALDKDQNPIVSFVRERCFKRSLNPTWSYDLHEGVIPKPEWPRQYITTWAVKHMRDNADILADRSRNITILENLAKSGTIDARMQFYFGKELYEAGRPQEAIPEFEKALQMPALEAHDRVLALQYAGYSCMQCFDQMKPEAHAERVRLFTKTIEFATQGIKQEPNRAEFYVLAGDSYVRIGDLTKAVPYFAAAKACLKNFDSPYEGAIYSFRNLYGEAPSLQLVKIYAHLGLLEKAKKEALECIEVYKSEEAKSALEEINRVSILTKLENNQLPNDEIVFTCPPQTAYPFDEEIYKTKPLGGSETALVQMAKLLKEKTGRPVKVFNMREDVLKADSGVEYHPAAQLNAYLSKNKPHTHIAWRHNIELTKAKTYLWCHDLVTPGVEAKKNFDSILCLSPFHKGYVQGMQGVPDDKVIVTRNGIDPKKFPVVTRAKDPNKMVWMSSPDRGLEKAMLVMDKVRLTRPNAELHVYYGLENLYKFGLADLAEKLKKMMADRPWVKYHGFTEQVQMYKDVSDACVWLHPCNFIETFCITALEMLALGVYPVTRRLGALANTLADAEKKGQATLLNHDAVTDAEQTAYASAVIEALEQEKWKSVSLDLDKHSWASVADEWIKFMDLAPSQMEAVS
jgi:glycosyltransferase involved in cell wall biosynthesis